MPRVTAWYMNSGLLRRDATSPPGRGKAALRVKSTRQAGRPPMLDGVMRRLLDPSLARAGAALAQRGVSADALTGLALATGLACAGAIALGAEGPAFLLLLLSR